MAHQVHQPASGPRAVSHTQPGQARRAGALSSSVRGDVACWSSSRSLRAAPAFSPTIILLHSFTNDTSDLKSDQSSTQTSPDNPPRQSKPPSNRDQSRAMGRLAIVLLVLWAVLVAGAPWLGAGGRLGPVVNPRQVRRGPGGGPRDPRTPSIVLLLPYGFYSGRAPTFHPLTRPPPAPGGRGRPVKISTQGPHAPPLPPLHLIIPEARC